MPFIAEILADTEKPLPPMVSLTDELEAEYVLISDKTSEVMKSELGTEGLKSLTKLASLIRKAGGEVTIFKSTKY